MDNKILGSFDLDTISRLADIVHERELSEITVADGDKVLTIKGKKLVSPAPALQTAAAPAVSVTAVAAADNTSAGNKKDSGNVVKSPIVGTYYASPSPDKPAFVKVGDTVKKGDVIMIIESMKLMNEVQSEYSGTVKEILVENGSAVEYDQPIMIIE